MAYTKLNALLVVLFSSGHVSAAMIRAPTPAVTPASEATAAPLVIRDITTIGYISTGMYGSATLYETITANNEGHIIATSASSLWKICAPESLCEFFSCENDYAIFPTTSIFCGGASSTCSYWELATDINDPAPLTNYWCDAKTETGGLILMVTPNDDASTSPNTDLSSNTPRFSSVTPTSRSGSPGSSDIPAAALPPSAEPQGAKKSTPVGAIAGGVVGGVALLAAVVLGIFFLLRRKKKQQQNNTTTVNNNMQQPPTAPQAPPAGVQYYHEQKPTPQQQVQPMPSPPPQHYGHYDPNAQQAPQFYDPNAQSAYATQQGGYAMPEKTPAATNPVQSNPYYADNSGPVSPVPQYTPSTSPAVPANVNELPAGRT